MSDIIIKHKTLGNGKFVSIYGKYIEVQFSDGIKKFFFPNAFDNNVLETENEELNNKIEQALRENGKQFHAGKITIPTAIHKAGTKTVVNKIQGFSSSFIGSRSGFIDFSSDEELFEVIGYLARPGRLAGIWAEIPNDSRELDFKKLFPGQNYMPITMTTTSGGQPSKYSPQFRINLANVNNCPSVLAPAIGKGLGTAVVGRINKSKFVVQLVHFFGFQFGNNQKLDVIKDKVAQYGYMDSFNKGFNR